MNKINMGRIGFISTYNSRSQYITDGNRKSLFPVGALCEALKVKTGIHWGPQDIVGVRAWGCLLGRVSYRKWNEPKR